MTLKSQVSAQCPVCSTDIVFYRVKPKFNCPACASTLGSNRSTVDVWAVLIYLLLAAVCLVGGAQLQLFDVRSYSQLAALAGASSVVAIATYCLLAPRALELATDTWSRDRPAAPEGKLQKILSYSETPDPKAAAEQKRVS
jgi:hypothetical protein